MRDGHRPASGTICPIGPWTVQCSPSMVWRQVHGRRLVKSRERGAFQERRDDIPDSLSDALSRIEGSRASGHQGIDRDPTIQCRWKNCVRSDMADVCQK
ncbi:hypothetical protein V8E51_010437 [Hyaloscypha variabilis]